MRRVLLAAVAVLATASAAHAEVPADAPGRLDTAIARFDDLVRKTQAEDRLPQLSNLAEKPVLDAVWDATILGRPPYIAKDLAALETMGPAAHRMITTYMGGERPSDQDLNLLKVPPKTLANVAKYPDEITRAMVFEFQITIDGLSAYADQWSHSEPAVRKTLEADLMPLRDGFDRALFHVFDDLAGAALSDTAKMVWADALARNAVAIADVTPVLAREVKLRELKSDLSDNPQPLKPKIAALIEAMSNRPCERLCLVQLLPVGADRP